MIMAMINNADELQYFARGISPAAAVEVYVRPLFRGLLTPAARSQDGLPSDSGTSAGSHHVDPV